MAQDWYVGIGGKARRIVKAYIGVGGKAREIVAGYVGVGGKARQFWGGGEAKYKGTTAANFRRIYTSSVGLDNHAIFEGYSGLQGSDEKWADAIDRNLTIQTCPDFSSKNRANMGAVRAGNYAVFGGGGTVSDVDIYSDSLVYSHTNLSRSLRTTYGASAGNIGVIGFGTTTSSSTENTYVWFFSTNLVVTETRDYATYARDSIATASTGTYALFAWGAESNSQGKTTLNAFNQNYVHTHATMTTGDDDGVSGAGFNGKAVLYGIENAIVNGVNPNLTTVSLDTLGKARRPAAASAGKNAIFIGDDYYSYGNLVDIYDNNFVHRYETLPMTDMEYTLTGSPLGRYAIFNSCYGEYGAYMGVVYTG